MLSEEMRQIMVENMQDSLRMIRHIMKFSIEDFAVAIGTTPKIIKDIETKKIKMTATQYIAVAALTDNYLESHQDILPRIKEIIDSDGKNYSEKYDTSFLEDSLIKRWFENFVTDYDEDIYCDDDTLYDTVADYKIFIDTEVLKMDCAEKFVENLILVLKHFDEKVVIPLRSIEQAKEDKDFAKVNQVLTLIQKLKDKGLVQIRGEDSDPDFKNTIINVFTRFHNDINLCLITPDKKLVYEIFKLNDSSESDCKVVAGNIEDGNFYIYDEEFLKNEMEKTLENGTIPYEDDIVDDTQEHCEGNGWDEV